MLTTDLLFSGFLGFIQGLYVALIACGLDWLSAAIVVGIVYVVGVLTLRYFRGCYLRGL